MKGLKAPGPDGFQPIFYQKLWPIVGLTLIKFVVNCFNSLYFPDQLSNSFITLIPKTDNPECINQFHPITLCNVTYKVITKIIVNKLRPLLNKLVGPYQASFMPGRQTKDNIIIT